MQVSHTLTARKPARSPLSLRLFPLSPKSVRERAGIVPHVPLARIFLQQTIYHLQKLPWLERLGQIFSAANLPSRFTLVIQRKCRHSYYWHLGQPWPSPNQLGGLISI